MWKTYSTLQTEVTMGIAGLCSIINGDEEKKIPSLCYPISLAEMNGKRIAVDANANFHQVWNKICRDACQDKKDLLELPLNMEKIVSQWTSSIIRRLQTWTSAGLIITVVLDGTAPADKEITQDERKKQTQKYLSEATEIVKKACLIAGVSYQEGSYYTGPLPSNLSFSQLAQIASLRDRHRQCLMNAINPIKDNWTYLGTRVSAEPGIVCVRSNVEAETLCCKMVLKGEADYVLSSDSDCLAYRVPVWLRDWDLASRSFVAVNLTDVLGRVELDADRFLEFCLLSGCDYNKKVKQRKNGSATRLNVLRLIKKAGSLETVMKDKTIDWSCVREEACKRIFNLELEVYPVELPKDVGEWD